MVNYEDDCWNFIWSCALYVYYERRVLSANEFDKLVYWLASNYTDLPDWFKRRVSLENLNCGSPYGLGLTFTDKELEDARNWRRTKLGV